MYTYYLENPLIHRDRRLTGSSSEWVRSFSCEGLKPLIVCRGPIRMETLDVFREMGMKHYGMLLSEKDSIVYPNALAPELRLFTDPSRVHRVPDYTGASKEERVERIHQIINIAHDNGYNAIFAGYGFMAEDEEFVAAIEESGLTFIGPCSMTQARAGKKDEAKRTAQSVNVSVTPGINNVTARTLLAKYKSRKQLLALVEAEGLECNLERISSNATPLEDVAEELLAAACSRGVDLFSMEELCRQVENEVAEMFRKYPGSRVRLKAIGGGGGKGQRILGGSLLSTKNPTDKQLRTAAADAPGLVREILNEVKANGVGDNKNILIELNIEQTRHNEIQLIGNGEWCVALGGRDCSLQMHEQKLLEISVTREGLQEAIAKAVADGRTKEANALESDLMVLTRMEEESERFGLAVGLDSVSTFECIVDRDRHFFMEVNTRIQVEHRVTELCYSLKFTNPDNPADYFVVESLVEAMALLAMHKQRLPRPERLVRFNSALEARLNATDSALAPHAGGIIRFWSKPVEGEIRDDQGISTLNPDTGVFMKYKIAGAYDSNIALLITKGNDRQDSFENMSSIIRSTTLRGTDLATNLSFHCGLVNWFLGNNVHAKPTTRFIMPYLAQVGAIKEESALIDLEHAFSLLRKQYMHRLADDLAQSPDSIPQEQKNLSALLDRKSSLIMRPMELLLADPHLLSGWLSMHTKNMTIRDGKVFWLRNPLGVILETYEYLHMSYRSGKPAAHMIWKHDHDLLNQSISFYTTLRRHFGLEKSEYFKLNELLGNSNAQGGYDQQTWEQIRAAHAGYQAGLEMFGIMFMIGSNTRFWELRVEEDLEITIPEHLTDTELQTRMRKVLAPPPATTADEIVAEFGGMYYSQEAPNMPQFVHEGMHFEKGQPLYIIEVMKMFNKVYAPFSGTIDQIIFRGGDGKVVHKGQPLFKITPDERTVEPDPLEIDRRRKECTARYINAVLC